MFGFKENKEPWRDGVYLTTADSTMQADILISKLAAEGIPCMKRHEGASNFLELYMGVSTMFPVELYVPEESLELALEIIRPVPIEDDFDEISEEELAALAEAGDLEAAEAAIRNGEEPAPVEIELEESAPEEISETEDEEPETELTPEAPAEELAETKPEEATEEPAEEADPETEPEESTEEPKEEPADEAAEPEEHVLPAAEPEAEEPEAEMAAEPPVLDRRVFSDDEDRECR